MCVLDKNVSGHIHETDPIKAARSFVGVDTFEFVPPTDGGEVCGLDSAPRHISINDPLFPVFSAPNYSAWRTDGGNDRP